MEATTMRKNPKRANYIKKSFSDYIIRKNIVNAELRVYLAGFRAGYNYRKKECNKHMVKTK
jgi:hypothetical protein